MDLKYTAKQVTKQGSKKAFLSGTRGLASLMAVSCLAFPLTAGASPAVPAPGKEILQSEEQHKAEIENSLPEKGAGTEAGIRFMLSRIRIEHEGMKLPEEGLEEITSSLKNREITAAELDAALNELTKYAREKGYPAAIAYIPEQTARGGNLLIRFEPGRFGSIKLESEGSLKESAAHRPLAGLKSGNIIEAGSLEQSLRNLNDIPGLEARAVISPGAEQGTSDLTVKLKAKAPNTYVLYTENYGSRPAGRYRWGLQADWKNLGGTGSRLNAGALISNGRQHGGSIAYEMPMGHSMTTLGISYSHSDYELGSIWSQLGLKGTSDTISLYGRTPLFNRYANSVNLIYALNYRKLKDEFNGFDIGDRHSTSFSIGVDGTCRTASNVLHYNVALQAGRLSPESAVAKAIAALDGTRGDFVKGTFDLVSVQQMSGPFDVLLKFSGQVAGSNLDSSEHIYLGGARGVRAYPQGEASGDEGIQGTMELRCHTKCPGLTLSTYLDAGHVHTVRSDSGGQTLKGWGLGLTYTKPDNWFARLDYARRIGTGENLSSDARSRQRLWFLLGKIF